MKKSLAHISFSPETPVRSVIEALSANDPKKSGVPSGVALVVSGGKGKLLGIATDGDIRKSLAAGSSLDMPVGEIMNTDPFTVAEADTPTAMLEAVAAKIRQKGWHKDHIEKIIVLDRRAAPVDIVSTYRLWQESDIRFKRIGIVGLGYVGLTLALTLADLGFTVLGYDKNPSVRRELKRGKPQFFEEGLSTLLADHLGKRFFVVDGFGGQSEADVYVLAVGTPLGKSGKSDLSQIIAASRRVGKVLKLGDLVLLRSTIPVGTTRRVVIPEIERVSGFRVGEGVLVAFAPERTVEGRALSELRVLPQVIGGFDHASLELAASIFSFMTKSIVTVGSLEEAEMVKLVNNTYRDVTFAFANEVSLSARAWGVDTKRIIEAANFGYGRSAVPPPSPGVGGYCLEKDPIIFDESARRGGYAPVLFRAARRVSDRQINSIVSEILRFLKKTKLPLSRAKVLLMGFAFKGRPATSDLRGSMTVTLLARLLVRGVKRISGFDPVVPAREIRRRGVLPVPNKRALGKALAESDVIVVMNNHPALAEIGMRSALRGASRPVLLVDAWSLYPPEELAKLPNVRHYRL